MKEKLLIIIGPTAVGKTDTSILLAKKMNGEIISADSMQIYKHMDIGTAKPSNDEMEGIKHYLIDEIDPAREYNVAIFQDMAKKYIQDISSRSKLPIIVGGTGLYVNSLVYTWDFTETSSDWEYRNSLEKLVKEKGKEYLHDKLREVDPESAKIIHPNNVKRVIRALEVYNSTGKTKSYYNDLSKQKENNYNLSIVGLTMDREMLYKRINLRVDLMIEKGLVSEVEKLLNMGYKEDLISMQALGYKEIIKYLKGEYSLEEAIEILKRDTRRFAKRQLTWFRRDNRIKWFDVNNYPDKNKLANEIVGYSNEIFK